MKKFILATVSFLVMTSAYAHQYIQCWDMAPNASERLILSLDKNKSTFFLSAEVNSDYPENSGLMELCQGRKINDIQEYWTRNEWAVIKVKLPSKILNANVSDFNLSTTGILHENGQIDFTANYSCYTAIYDYELNRKVTPFCRDYESEYLKTLK